MYGRRRIGIRPQVTNENTSDPGHRSGRPATPTSLRLCPHELFVKNTVLADSPRHLLEATLRTRVEPREKSPACGATVASSAVHRGLEKTISTNLGPSVTYSTNARSIPTMFLEMDLLEGCGLEPTRSSRIIVISAVVRIRTRNIHWSGKSSSWLVHSQLLGPSALWRILL